VTDQIGFGLITRCANQFFKIDVDAATTIHLDKLAFAVVTLVIFDRDQFEIGEYLCLIGDDRFGTAVTIIILSMDSRNFQLPSLPTQHRSNRNHRIAWFPSGLP